MQSLVSLFNTALARLGGNQLERVNSPDEEGATAALCRNLFSHVADVALSAFPWSFARQRVSLALKGDGIAAYPYRYALPVDCLRPVAVAGAGTDNAATYLIEGQDLLTAVNPAEFLYVARKHDPSVWPAAFADVVAWGLSAELATALINDAGRQRWHAEQFQRSLHEASRQDQSQQRLAETACQWLDSRE